MFLINPLSSSRPLPLKQRTSSIDTRRDYSHSTWWSLVGLLKVREFFVTVDNFSIWRRHLAWAMKNGKDLRGYMTQRYGSSMVFMSLLLSTELAILFNSAPVTTQVREAMREGRHNVISFWAGFFIMVSALLTVLSLIALFTAWGMVNSIDEVNVHCIFRSSIGQYAAELPGRLIVCSIYAFLLSFMIFFFLLFPVGTWSITLAGVTFFLFMHIITTFSAFGRIIMHTGAMGSSRIFSPKCEEGLVPHSLHSELLSKARANLQDNTSIISQYRDKQQPIDRILAEDKMLSHLREEPQDYAVPDSEINRHRANSTVKFADVTTYGLDKDNDCHSRPLTPLSDLSSLQQHGEGRSSDPTGQMDNSAPTYSSRGRNSVGGPSKNNANLNFPFMPSPTYSASSGVLPQPSLGLKHQDSGFINSSFEEWLNKSNGLPKGTKKAHLTEHSNQAPETSFPSGNSFSNGRPKQISNSGQSTPTIHLRRSESELSLNDRHLWEDEQFTHDYGNFEQEDITSNDIDDKKPRAHILKGYGHNHDREQQSLLDSGTRFETYVSPFSNAEQPNK